MNNKKMTLMIFHADGGSRTIPFNLSALLKGSAAFISVLFTAILILTGYNAYSLFSVKKEYTNSSETLTSEKRTVCERLNKLEDFEEKISYQLVGALTDQEGVNFALDRINYSGGLGSGDDTEFDSAEMVEIPLAPVVPENQEEEKTALPDSTNIELRVEILRDHLTELAVLAVKEKNRLDLSPSISPSTGYVTSYFGWRRSPFTGRRDMHRGIDIVNRIGTPVRATANGTISFAGNEAFWGNAVFIEHRDGIVSKYGHMSSLNVKEGDHVTRGQVIGFIGMTGRTTGPHVHYQIEINGQPINPMQYIIDESDIN